MLDIYPICKIQKWGWNFWDFWDLCPFLILPRPVAFRIVADIPPFLNKGLLGITHTVIPIRVALVSIDA